MKHLHHTIASLALLVLGFSSCQKGIVIDKIDESRYDNLSTIYASVVDADTGLSNKVIEIRRDEVEEAIKVIFTRNAGKNVRVSIRYDARSADRYNEEHNTDFDLLPEESFELEEDVITLGPSETRSENLPIRFSPLLDEEEGTFILPLKLSIKEDGVKGSEQPLVYLVKNLKNQATAIRREGEKHIFCYFEVNDTNPLNVLAWEMEDGRLLIDYLVLFAFNIKYDEETGEVYCFANPNCQFILDNYDQVIKPLRDRGVKVIVGLLGASGPAGLAQLSELGAKRFAANLASICYGYGFDGLNFDDEYSGSPDLSNPLFASHSTSAGNRLIYECKQAMPDLLMTSYQYGSCLGNGAVDGHQPGEYLDITVGDYGRRGVPYSGMTNAQCSYQSSEFALGRALPTASELSNFKNSDYGYWMIFSAWCSGNQGGKTHFDRLNTMAQGIYGSSLKKPEYYWPETRSLETLPISW